MSRDAFRELPLHYQQKLKNQRKELRRLNRQSLEYEGRIHRLGGRVRLLDAHNDEMIDTLSGIVTTTTDSGLKAACLEAIHLSMRSRDEHYTDIRSPHSGARATA